MSAPSPWQSSEIVEIRPETRTATTFRLALERPVLHRPGQHYVVRLTAPDGYTAQRSYSIASAPDDTGTIELTVEQLPDGEVSGYLHDVAEVGDVLEVRGPIGGWFVWDADAPAVLVGGGSGVVPLMSMLRQARRLGRAQLVRLVVSIRRPEDLYYADEVVGPETTVVATRAPWPGTGRAAAHLSAGDLPPIADDATVYVCGSNGFADATTELLQRIGVPAARIRVERFGATA